MKDISGNIKEDEQAAFELICERTDTDQAKAKGVGYFNRLLKLCSIAKLPITIDYSEDRFTVSNVPGIKAEAPVKEEKKVNVKISEKEEDEDDPFAL
jgi:hypothetical protein